MQGEQLLQNPDFAKTLAKSPFKAQDLPRLSTAIADAFQRLTPDERQTLKGGMDELSKLPLEKLRKLANLLDYIDKNKEEYPQVIDQLVKSGAFDKGELPDKYDPRIMAVVRTLVGQAILKVQGNAPQGYADGGIVSLKKSAKDLRAAGRNGDTILAHINPAEATMLRKMGGSGTINPNTGLPEFGWFTDIFGSFGSVVKTGAKIVATAALSYFIGPAAAGAVVGGVSTLLEGGSAGAAMKSALIGGALGGLTAGVSNVASGTGGFWEGATAGGSLTGSAPYETWVSKGLAGTSVGNTLFPGNPADARAAEAAAAAAGANSDLKPAADGTPAKDAAASGTPAPAGGGVKPVTSPGIIDSSLDWMKDHKLATLGIAGAGLIAADSMTKSKPQPTMVDKSVTGASLIASNPKAYGYDPETFFGKNKPAKEVTPVTVPGNYVDSPIPARQDPNLYDYSKIQYPDFFPRQPADQSGIMAAKVGGPISGPGNGTSDSIPARLSDGEFVMTAKAVRGAGAGSRREGAKKLYGLMHKFERMA